MKKLAVISLLVGFSIFLVSCAPQQPPPVIVNVPAQQQAPQQQQQQQNQTIIIQQPPAVAPVVPVPVPVQGWCGYLRQSNLRAGWTVYVTTTPELFNRIRRGPSFSSQYMGQIKLGEAVYLISGPYCDNGQYIYWQVNVLDKDNIYDRQFPKSQYNNVYTAETDSTGSPWLAP